MAADTPALDPASANTFPLRCGTDAELAVLRALLARAAYNEADICQRLKLDLIHEIDSPQARVRLSRFDDGDAQGVLAKLFLLGNAVPASKLEPGLTTTEVEALRNVDLIRTSAQADGEALAHSPVRLAPMTVSTVSLVLASDRAYGVDWRPIIVSPDVVFSPQSRLTREFLGVLPTPAAGSVLDLCTGSGVAALIVGSRVTRRVAVDVAARSAHFARFNAWLNEGPPVDVRVGDLYAPLGDERFTWIVAHPPYVPNFQPTALFRDGGELGDVVVRGIVSRLPDHLDVGGTCYIVTQGMDMTDGRFEEQARRWMGEAGAAFDIVFAISKGRTAESLASLLVEGAPNPEPDLEERTLAAFRARGVSRAVHGALVLRRLKDGERGETQRVTMSSATRAASFDHVFAWMAAGRSPRFIERLMASTPKIRDGTKLEVVNVLREGDFVPESFRLTNRGEPFPSTIEAEPWVVRLVMALDGRTSLADALARVRAAGHLPEGFSQADADVVLRYLAERGVLAIELGN